MTEANNKTSPRLMSSQAHGSDYGIFLLGVPIAAALSLLVVAVVTHSVAYLVLVFILAALACGIFAALEVFHAPLTWKSDNPVKHVFRWMGFVTVLWPYGYPVYLRARKKLGLDDWLKGGLVTEAILIAGVAGAIAITVTGYGKTTPQQVQQAEQQIDLLKSDPRWVPDADDVEIVQSGHLNTCMDKSVKQLVDGYFEKPQWEAGAATGGIDFVNVSGIVTYQGKPVTATFQFEMDKDKRGFRYRGFEIAGVPQTLFVAAFTLAEMCAQK